MKIHLKKLNTYKMACHHVTFDTQLIADELMDTLRYYVPMKIQVKCRKVLAERLEELLAQPENASVVNTQQNSTELPSSESVLEQFECASQMPNAELASSEKVLEQSESASQMPNAELASSEK